MHPLSGLDILIVDDQAIIASALQMLLEDLGAQSVWICTRSNEAHAFLENNAPHMAFVDWHLGDITARTLLERLQSMSIPTILITGYILPKEQKQAWPQTIIVQKPYTDEQIEEAIRATLSVKAHVLK
jgi:CheY-like chemotaxis protein